MYVELIGLLQEMQVLSKQDVRLGQLDVLCQPVLDREFTFVASHR